MQQKKAAIKVTPQNKGLVRIGFFLTMCFVFIMIYMPTAGYRLTFDIGLPEAINTVMILVGLICGTAIAYRTLYNWTEKP